MQILLEPHDYVRLASIARSFRRLNQCILLSLAGVAVAFAGIFVATVNEEAGLLVAILGGTAALIGNVGGLIYAYRTGRDAGGSGTTVMLVLLIGFLFGCGALLAMLYAANKATQELRLAGVHVSLLGVRAQELARLEAAAV